MENRKGKCSILIGTGTLGIEIPILLIIYVFLLTYFEPQYFLLETTTTGGDTASHYYTAKYLKETLIPMGKLMGWNQGNYAGHPLFHFYFPLPFILMVLGSLFISLKIAFKIVTVLGIFFLPLCTYLSLKLLKYRFPIPIIAALFTLPFLFMEANSMWGGNISSTLAGEFSYSLSFALSILFVGSLYNGIASDRHVIKNGILLAFIGLSHGYTLLFSALVSSFLLITTEDFQRKLKYLFKIHILGFLMIGLWIIPFIFNLPYTTHYSPVWVINSILEILPVILIPFVGIAILGRAASIVSFIRTMTGIQGALKEGLQGALKRVDTKICYLWYCVIISLIMYLIAPIVPIVDARFLPLLQVFLMIIAAVELGKRLQMVRLGWLFSLIVVILVILWVNYNVKYIKSWIHWNYMGFEAKPLWSVFSSITTYLTGTTSDPRIAHEHSPLHNEIGTIRAFESIPLFSGRSTLEGLYMQSSISSPFIFYIQSEISKECSCPFPDFSCSTFNMPSAIRHLKMFNVREFIVRSEEVKFEVKKYPEFILKRSFGPYEIYELSTNENRYVTLLRYEPVLYETDNWKDASYKWFKNSTINDVHLVFKKTIDEDSKRFKTVMKEGQELSSISRIPVDMGCHIEEEIKKDEILITTNCINKPLLIKISYHPNWKVEGAEKVYLASPSFMLIFPQRRHITLRFSNTIVEYVGMSFSIIALVIIILNFPIIRSYVTIKGYNRMKNSYHDILRTIGGRSYTCNSILIPKERNRSKLLVSTLLILSLFLFFFLLFFRNREPRILNTKGMRYLEDNRYSDARGVFETVITEYPNTPAENNASYHYAICYLREANYERSIEEFHRFIKNYPKDYRVPGAYYYIALCYASLDNTDKAKKAYQFVVDKYPVSNWAQYSRRRLIELTWQNKEGSQDIAAHLFNKATGYFNSGKYYKARKLFSNLVERYPKARYAEYSAYFSAICFFKEQKYRDTIREFDKFIRDYPQSAYIPEAYYHIGLSYQELKDSFRAKEIFLKIIKDFPNSRWAVYARDIYRTL